MYVLYLCDTLDDIYIKSQCQPTIDCGAKFPYCGL